MRIPADDFIKIMTKIINSTDTEDVFIDGVFTKNDQRISIHYVSNDDIHLVRIYQIDGRRVLIKEGP